MFNDVKEALEAEALEVTPVGSDQNTAASLVVAHRARDKDDLVDLLDDLVDLLDALGLPCSEDDIARLLPHLPTPSPGDPMTVNAYTATAASMLNNGDSPEHVRETLGLSEQEMAAALLAADPSTPQPTPDSPGTDVSTDEDGIDTLLDWAQDHPAAAIRNKAARIRTDLSDLKARRTSEHAIGQAETEVARLADQLEQAKKQLKALKTNGASAATGTAPTPLRAKRTKEENARIRAWARANGHPVGQGGVIKQSIVDAYEKAHATDTKAQAS